MTDEFDTPYIVADDEPPAGHPEAVALNAAVDEHLEHAPTATIELPTPVLAAARERADAVGDPLDVVLLNRVGLEYDIRAVDEGDETVDLADVHGEAPEDGAPVTTEREIGPPHQCVVCGETVPQGAAYWVDVETPRSPGGTEKTSGYACEAHSRVLGELVEELARQVDRLEGSR